MLICVIALVAIVLTFAFRSILFDQARMRIDRTSADIARVAGRTDPLFFFGDAPIEQELANQNNLEHWATPTIFVEIDNRGGYPIGKSSNLGSWRFAPNLELTRQRDTAYRVETTPVGDVLVQDRLVAVAGREVVVVHVGETLALVNATLLRARRTLALVLVIAAAAVVGASFALATSAVEPINQLAQAMREIGSDRLDRRLNWTHRNDEVGRLASTFDAMLARLEEAFARERQFISDASHELKTPLTVINANAQMLQRWADRDPQIRADSLDAIIGESGELARLVNGMLTLAKAESGDGVPKEPLRIAEIVGESVKAAQVRAEHKGLDLSSRVEGGARSALVLGDHNLLRQLVGNLIDNAIKFTERGFVEVAVRCEGPEVLLDVSDSGVGIDEASLGRVFDRFYRADKSRSRHIEGTGLGLAIVRSIARVHEGRVWAERRGRAGTTVHVALPSLAEDNLIPPS